MSLLASISPSLEWTKLWYKRSTCREAISVAEIVFANLSAVRDADKVVCVQVRTRPIRDGLDAVLRGLLTC